MEGFSIRSSAHRTSVVRHAQLSISVKKQVGFGDKVIVVGNQGPLGSWNVEGAAELTWNAGDVWTGSVEVPNGADLEFKCVVSGRDTQWENGDNRKIHVRDNDMAVLLEWNNTTKFEEVASNGSQSNGASAPPREEGSLGKQNPNGSVLDDRLPHTKWQGKDINFMQDNNHAKDRRGVWNHEGLEGPMLELVQGDQKAGSWLQKLDVAKRLIVDKSEDMRPRLDTLAPLYIYLHWISTGSIQCVEGGGHFRPNRHAELSKIMFRSAEWVSGDHRRTPLERLVARKLVSKLPSFSEAFTATVPLTRIRDIAHRNDIPSDLKREIKHTLQNKLHRNAGPEDLVATELMLEKVTRNPGEFNDAFVKEFKIFTEELRDFFSAGSLTFMLDAVQPTLDESERVALQRFIEAKDKVDRAAAAADMNLVMDLLHKLTTVRAILLSKLASGLRNDAPDSAMVMRQRVRLAEIRCEEYGYVTLSRMNNLIDAQGGPGFLAGAREEAWALPLGGVVLAVRNCGLSGWQPAECYAIEQELQAWESMGVASDRDEMLRLKATLERTKRLTDTYAQVMLDTFADAALDLGSALGIPDEIQQVFTEAEIRANIAFQLSKLSSLLLKAARNKLGSGDYDTLVTGTAVGELVAVDQIRAGQQHAGGRPCILLVERADGDEEVAAAGKNIRGVILCQDLPHLSHLGVRARQEGVTFVTCTTREVIDGSVRPLVGKRVELVADASRVALAETSSSGEAGAGGNGAAPAVADVQSVAAQKVARMTVLPLSAAVTETSGAKAAACAVLAQAARNATPGAEFSAVPGAVLPFGCLEAAVKGARLEKEYAELLQQTETAGVDALQAVCDDMQRLIMRCPPDAATLSAIRKELPGASIVIARSSANVEDLAGMSGAGLYDSIPNLEVASDESLGRGISEVWASLFARRAVLSRRAANVSQKDACMAFLIQEMLAPSTCFVLHTRNPLGDQDSDRGASSLYAEIAPGMGEILASGTSGSAWRMTVDKASNKVSTLAFANFSRAYMPTNGKRAPEHGASIYWSSDDSMDSMDGGAPIVMSEVGKVSSVTVDYSKQALSVDAKARTSLAQQLCRVGVLLEERFGAPQDIEGALVGNKVYIVQTRPQP